MLFKIILVNQHVAHFNQIQLLMEIHIKPVFLVIQLVMDVHRFKLIAPLVLQ
jgi:hypothetical protein